MRVLLDTVAFLLAVKSPESLSREALSGIRNEDALREISAVSISEIAIKRATGKLDFDREDLLRSLDDLQTRVLAYSTEHVLAMFDLPVHHRDPFDRQIIAQALVENIPIITSDRIFRRYKGVRIIW